MNIESLDLIALMYIFYILAISVGGFLVNVVHYRIPIPQLFIQAFKFGKMNIGAPKMKLLDLLEVPKK